jgi:hypothetical protein
MAGRKEHPQSGATLAIRKLPPVHARQSDIDEEGLDGRISINLSERGSTVMGFDDRIIELP